MANPMKFNNSFVVDIKNEDNSFIIEILGGRGPKGLKGKDGYTPVKGTDYWTDSDKDDMASYVIDKALNYGTAPSTASGMALVAKTIVDGIVTEWEFGEAGGLKIRVCTANEYDPVSREPVIVSPDEKTLYLVPAENSSSPDLFIEWAYVDNNWEMFGSARIDLSGYLTDVKVNGTSTVTDGVAEIPLASSNVPGVVRLGSGLASDGVRVSITKATNSQSRTGTEQYNPIVPSNQHVAAFYGLAKAAGDTTQSQAVNSVGNYTENAKSAIRSMLDIGGETQTVHVTGTTPFITANKNTRYICGEVATLNFIPSVNGICNVIFTSGSTPCVLTVPNDVIFPSWFDSTALEANTIYEISISDGIYGAVMTW